MPDDLSVEVIYACPVVQDLVRLSIAPPVSVKQALAASGLLEKHALNIDAIGFGIFGERVKLTDGLKDQDRLEIYRPITIDPKQKRVMKVKDSTLPRRCR